MKVLFRVIAVLYLIFPSSCTKEDDPLLDQYLFLEQHTTISGELMTGPEPPQMQIDFPTYTFHEETGILDGIIDFSTGDDLKIIYGSGACLTGTAGGGCATGLTGIYEIPFERDGFELLKLDESGEIVFIYNGEVQNLLPGEDWISTFTELDTVMVDGQMSISMITYNERVTNFGFQEKSNIEKWDW